MIRSTLWLRELKMTSSERIKLLVNSMMDSEHLSQRDLAKKVGVSYTTIQNWVEGEFAPRAGSLSKLAKYLGWDEQELMSFVETGQPPKTVNSDQIPMLIRIALPLKIVGVIAHEAAVRLDRAATAV